MNDDDVEFVLRNRGGAVQRARLAEIGDELSDEMSEDLNGGDVNPSPTATALIDLFA